MGFDSSLYNSHQVTILIFLLATVGLIGIYFAVKNIDPTELNIEQIEDSMTGKLVRISGSISNIRKSKSGNSYWTVDDGSNITVPILSNEFKKLTPKRGDMVEIIGLVSKYNEELEIMPKEISIR
jgi:RecJ-like exonuclease